MLFPDIHSSITSGGLVFFQGKKVWLVLGFWFGFGFCTAFLSNRIVKRCQVDQLCKRAGHSSSGQTGVLCKAYGKGPVWGNGFPHVGLVRIMSSIYSGICFLYYI